MRKRGALAWLKTCLVTLMLMGLAACGGGGGGGGSSGSVTISMTTPAEQTMVEGNTPEVYVLSGQLNIGKDAGDFFVLVEGDERLLADASPYGMGSALNISVRYVPDLAAGDYQTTLTVHTCADDQCKRELGPSVRVPLTLHVRPNISVQRQVSLTRTGREAAPSLALPVTIPADAGTVNLSTNINDWNALALSFDGTALRVDTRQVPAGTYTATATLWSSTNSRYSRTVNIEYTVQAPAGGQQAIAATPAITTLSLPQGSRSVQQVRVTRPTWTDVWRAPTLASDSPGMATLRDLGNDVYEVTIDTAGKTVGHYGIAVTFDAGPTGGTAAASFYVDVEDVFSLSTALPGIELNASSTASDLERAIPIAMVDGTSRRWTATTTSPYMRIASTSGMTGSDALRLSVDPALLEQDNIVSTLPFSVSVDVPGSLPRAYELRIDNRIPRLRKAVTHTLVSNGSRVYVQGLLSGFDYDLDWRNRLQVTGATLVQANALSDSRFGNTQSVLALDLTGLTPGQDVTVRYNSVLAPTQVQFQVQAPFTSAVAYQSLPFARYRPGQFSPGLTSLYFAGPGTVYRWTYATGSWTLSQASMPGVIDVSPSPDESVVYANGGSLMWALQPQSFAVQATGDLTTTRPTHIWPSFDPAAPTTMQGMTFSADGRALGGVWGGQVDATHGVAWICSLSDYETGLAPLTTQLSTCDPGTGGFHETQGFGVIRSPNGHTVVATGLSGEHWRYRVLERRWQQRSTLPAGVQVVAVADDGIRWVRSDGLLMSDDVVLGNLTSAVPVGYEAGGYGLSAAGGYGLVYGYRRTGTGPAERATDAKVWIVDLANVVSTGITNAPLLDTVSLPQPVGCTDTLASGETCAHRASITVAAGQRAAFVIGPRGVAVLPLPSGTTEAQVLRTSRGVSRPQTLSSGASDRKLRRSMRRSEPPIAGNDTR